MTCFTEYIFRYSYRASGNAVALYSSVLKLFQRRFGLGTRRRFFTQRVVGHQNRLPRVVVTVQSLTKFMKPLDNALRHIFLEVGLDGPCGYLPAQDIL